MSPQPKRKPRREKFYTGANTCAKCGVWVEAGDEYEHCAKRKTKPRRCDYHQQAASAVGYLHYGATHAPLKRVLRKLVREAIDRYCEALPQNANDVDTADRIAKALVP